MEEIQRVKGNVKKLDAEDRKAEAILRALNRLEEELANERSSKERMFEKKRKTSKRRNRRRQHCECRKDKGDPVAPN